MPTTTPAPRIPRQTDIAVSGIGACSPFGPGVHAYTQALRQARSATQTLPSHRQTDRISVAAPCPDLQENPLGPDASKLPRLIPYALLAAREALTDAGIPLPATDTLPAPDDRDRTRRIGLILGTGAGGIDFTLDQATIVHQGKRQSLWTITNATHGNLAGELSIRLGLHGPSLCLSTGCASSSDAIARATDLLRLSQLKADQRSEAAPGLLDAVVVVGADAHVRPETLSSMDLLGVLARQDDQTSQDPATIARPFDANRSGFVLGEGAWALVLERPDALARRSTKPRRATILGHAATCDAYHRVKPAPDMAESVRAIETAIDDANLQPTDIELVQYHGTSTKLNDAAETRAIHQAFGDHAKHLQGSSIKGAIGHPQGACGAAATVAMIAALNNPDPFIPPTINLDTPDPECDLDYTPNQSKPTDTKTVLVNCLAFGAKNTAIILNAEPAR